MNGFLSGANCSQCAIFLSHDCKHCCTYTGVYEVKMQHCHHAFSDATSTCFISTLKILTCIINTKTPTNAYIMHALNARYKIIVSFVHV